MLPLLAVALASLTAVAILNAWLSTSQTQRRIENQLQSVVAVLAESNFPLTDSVLTQMGGLANSEFVLTDRDGNEIASTLSRPVPGLSESQTPFSLSEVKLGLTMSIGPDRYFHSSVWAESHTRTESRNVLHILFPHQEYNAAWRTAFLPPVIVGGIAILMAIVVTQWVASRLSREFRKLGDEVNRLADGDFSDVSQPKWNDETKDLAEAVNQTARRLADYETEIRRTEQIRTTALLGAGLAHEMRNAATGCRLAVDLHSEDCSCQSNDDTLQVARQQLRLMESRLQRFLQLGKRPDNSADQDVDLCHLVDELITLVTPAARHAGVSLDWDQPSQEVIVRSDPELLGQAIVNLLHNALEAASAGQTTIDGPARIQVSLKLDESETQLSISDSGQGISREMAQSVFEPFSTDKPEGVGLGLAVARQAVESAGGRISWERINDQTHFQICLPLACVGVEHV